MSGSKRRLSIIESLCDFRSYLERRVPVLFGDNLCVSVKRLIKSEPSRRRSGSLTINKKPMSPLKKRKRPSHTTSPISQCLITQMSTPWMVESMKRRSDSLTHSRNLVSATLSSYGSAGNILPGPNTPCHFSSMGTIVEQRSSERKPVKPTVKIDRQQAGRKDGWRNISTKISLKRLTSISRRKTHRQRGKSKRGDGYRFSITEPMTDPSVIQTLLMPKYQNENGPNVRKWLSDSNVKYVHEAGPYEKISAKLLLNGSHVPSEETVFQCLIDCLSTSSSMRVIEGIIPLFEWMVRRMLKKLNPSSMMRILELGFLICQQIPCKCSTLKNSNYNTQLRYRVLNVIGLLHTPEHENCFVSTLKMIIETKKIDYVFDFVHAILEYCTTSGDQPDIIGFLSRQTFKAVILIAANSRDRLYNNANLCSMARLYVAYIRQFHPVLFNQVLLTILLDGKKQRDEYDAEVAAQLSVDDRKRLTRTNAHVKKTTNVQKSPKFTRTTARLLDETTGQTKLLPRRGGAVSIATTTNVSSGGKNMNSTGVGRAMFRRITGIVGSKTESDEEIKSDTFKAKSFTCLNKLPNVFKKDEGDIRTVAPSMVPTNTQRRPATLGLPQFKSDLTNTITAQREPSQPKIIVPIAKLREGVKIFRTLLELSPPGTVPDVKILKEVVGMKAPILCRALLIFELIRHVRKLSHSWPRWMLELQTESEDGNQFKDFVHLKLTAGKLFYGWAESLATQLDEYGKLDSEMTMNRHPKRHSVASFLFDTDINPRQNNVPKSLRMIVIVLLSEITHHLKEHHTKIRGTVKNQVFLSLPKRHKIRAVSSNASSSPKIAQGDDFFDETSQLHIGGGRNSELNRSNRGKLEFISQGLGGVRSIFNRLTSKEYSKDYSESRDSVTEIEDIKKKASSFRASMTKPDCDLSRINRNVKWINSVARCLAEENFTCDHSNGCLFHCAVHLKESCDSLTDAIKLVAHDTKFKSYEVPVFDREAFVFLNKYETKPTESTLNDMHVITLQFIIENIVEVTDETLKMLITPCWNLLQSRNTRINQQAAVIVILAAQKFQAEMNLLIEQKIASHHPIHDDFQVLWVRSIKQ